MRVRPVLLAMAVSFVGGVFADEVRLTPANVEVVVTEDAPPALMLAASEMTNVLSQVFSRAVPLRRSPTSGLCSVVLGTNVWSRTAGLDPARLPRDAFQVREKDGRIYIAGIDHPEDDLEHRTVILLKWMRAFERGTLFGVYDFLERFAGVRFYFPGELGTVVPKRDGISIQRGLSYESAPRFSVRRYGYGDGALAPELLKGFRDEDDFRLAAFYRYRMETKYIHCCHGQNGFLIQKRFAKEHPEYMALFKGPDGRLIRDVDPKIPNGSHPGQACQSSAVWDQMADDCEAYFRGERRNNALIWSVRSKREAVDVMPQDGMIRCQCDRCQAAYEKDPVNYATDLVWRQVVRLAEKLKRDGFGDRRVRMMSYAPYGNIPDFEIPDNVDVMVARGGPWSKAEPARLDAQMDDIRRWSEKIGRKVWLWTYPGKVSGMNVKGVPQMSPRAWGEYYQKAAPWIFGAFAESESDKWIYNYLNYYVFSRVCWDSKTDIEALLREHHRLMFGAAAKEMTAVYDLLERQWVYGVTGHVSDSAVGPRVITPPRQELFTCLYSRKILRELATHFIEAAKLVPSGSLEARRIAFFRREFLMPMVEASKAYFKEVDPSGELAWRAAHPNTENLVDDPSFDRKPVSGTDKYEKGRPWLAADAHLDGKTYFSAPRSLRLESTERFLYVPQYLRLKPLKPNTRYRVSFFVKGKDIKPLLFRDGGACVELNDGGGKNWMRHPWPYLFGTFDWMGAHFEVKTGSDATKMSKDGFVCLRIINATGTAWFDDIRVEEIGKE